MNVNDLPEADAVYPQTCNVNFCTNRQLPEVYEGDDLRAKKKGKSVVPKVKKKRQALVKNTKFFEENDDWQIAVGDLVEKMEEYSSDTEPEAYGRSHMKIKPLQCFEDKIITTDIHRKTNRVTFRTKAAAILQEFNLH